MQIDIRDKNFFYQDIAMPISDIILNLFKEGCKEYFDYHQWVYDHPIDSDDPVISYRISVIRSEFDSSKKMYDIWGSAGIDESGELSIWITFVIPPRKWQKNIEISRAELIGTLAHELHHIAQSMQRVVADNPPDKRFAYFLDPMEVEAFHVGFRAQSKLSGRSFDIIATEYLRSANTVNFSEDEICRVVNMWKETDYPVFSSVAA